MNCKRSSDEKKKKKLEKQETMIAIAVNVRTYNIDVRRIVGVYYFWAPEMIIIFK